jgi:hypothetical protein
LTLKAVDTAIENELGFAALIVCVLVAEDAVEMKTDLDEFEEKTPAQCIQVFATIEFVAVSAVWAVPETKWFALIKVWFAGMTSLYPELPLDPISSKTLDVDLGADGVLNQHDIVNGRLVIGVDGKDPSTLANI